MADPNLPKPWGVCVDSLLLHFLQQQNRLSFDFDGTIRTKATLFSNKLVETRGWEPVEELSKDMVTHVSRYDACLQSFPEGSAASTTNPGARDPALQIVSLLGQLPPPKPTTKEEEVTNNNDDYDYDPWANAANMLR